VAPVDRRRGRAEGTVAHTALLSLKLEQHWPGRRDAGEARAERTAEDTS